MKGEKKHTHSPIPNQVGKFPENLLRREKHSVPSTNWYFPRYCYCWWKFKNHTPTRYDMKTWKWFSTRLWNGISRLIDRFTESEMFYLVGQLIMMIWVLGAGVEIRNKILPNFCQKFVERWLGHLFGNDELGCTKYNILKANWEKCLDEQFSETVGNVCYSYFFNLPRHPHTRLIFREKHFFVTRSYSYKNATLIIKFLYLYKTCFFDFLSSANYLN